jgi:exopolyphosphatase/guanosine-5'-triphosphate,3'-diphosphate pyrophosphatase
LKLAAIDIGSNAIRLQITNILAHDKSKPIFKKLEYVRFPLRLGQDVFTIGEIGAEKKDKFIKLMQTFKLLMELYEVDHYMGCATSAMRESANGQEVVQYVADKIGININIIDGDAEAKIVNNAIQSFLAEETFLHIDVGGGSTELNLYIDGDKVNSISFKMGSVRSLAHHDTPEVWLEMENWVKANILQKHGQVTAIGTGGNINKIYDLADQKEGKMVTLREVKTVMNMVRKHSYQERISYLQLNPDRADVIVPASQIYIAVMEWANADQIIVPDVGLKDGIMHQLYQTYAVQ